MTFWLIALAYATLAPAASPDPSILGQWEAVDRTKGGVGNILQFFADGRVTQISAAMAEADYQVQGEWLRTFWKDPATGKTSEANTLIEFRGDELGEKASDGSSESWSERIGPRVSAASPLLGQWCGLYLEILPSYREFTATRMFIRTPVLTLRGRYAISGNTMTVEIDGQPKGEFPFRLEDGILVIRSLGGSEKRYRRTESTLLRGE